MTTAPNAIISNQHPIVPGASIGHVHLNVSDIDRAAIGARVRRDAAIWR
jgi:catechol-2,3-dioxygenase